MVGMITRDQLNELNNITEDTILSLSQAVILLKRSRTVLNKTTATKDKTLSINIFSQESGDE